MKIGILGSEQEARISDEERRLRLGDIAFKEMRQGLYLTDEELDALLAAEVLEDQMPKHDRSCANCGKPFADRHKSARFCGRECADEHAARSSREANRLRYPLLTKECVQCGCQFETARKSVICCSKQCRDNRQQTMNRGIGQAGRFTILQRDSFRCVYCGATPLADGVRLTVDHVFPMFHGGNGTASNLATACEYCNKAKHDKPLPPLIQSEILAIIEKRNREQGIDPQLKIKGTEQDRDYAKTSKK